MQIIRKRPTAHNTTTLYISTILFLPSLSSLLWRDRSLTIFSKKGNRRQNDTNCVDRRRYLEPIVFYRSQLYYWHHLYNAINWSLIQYYNITLCHESPKRSGQAPPPKNPLLPLSPHDATGSTLPQPPPPRSKTLPPTMKHIFISACSVCWFVVFPRPIRILMRRMMVSVDRNNKYMSSLF